MLAPRTKLSLQKDLGFFGGLSASLASFAVLGAALTYFLSIPMIYVFGYTAGVFALSLFTMLRKNNYFPDHYLKGREINLKKKKENFVFRVVEKLAKTAGIKTPKVIVTNNADFTKFAVTHACSTGWPANNAVYIEEYIIHSSISEGALRALLAHEIAHIRNRDSLASVIISVFMRAAKYHFTVSMVIAFIFVMTVLFASIISMSWVLSSLVPSLALLAINVFNKGSHLATKALRRVHDRAREYIADFDAAVLTDNPKETAYYQRELECLDLKRGILSFDGVSYCYEDKDDKKWLSLIHKDLYKYAEKSKKMQPNNPQLPGKLFTLIHPILAEKFEIDKHKHKFSFYYKTFKMTHPPTEQRQEAIIKAFSNAKKTRSKI